MPTEFDFISPGVLLREVDESVRTPDVEDDGLLVIGQSVAGPINKPVKIKSRQAFYNVFGRPQSGKGKSGSDVWRDGNEQVCTYAAYAAEAWLASETSPVTFMRLGGEDQVASKRSTGYTAAGWNTQHTIHQTNPAAMQVAYGLWVFASGATHSEGKLGAVIYTSGAALSLNGKMHNNV